MSLVYHPDPKIPRLGPAAVAVLLDGAIPAGLSYTAGYDELVACDMRDAHGLLTPLGHRALDYCREHQHAADHYDRSMQELAHNNPEGW